MELFDLKVMQYDTIFMFYLNTFIECIILYILYYVTMCVYVYILHQISNDN